jgi:hypothetical protein
VSPRKKGLSFTSSPGLFLAIRTFTGVQLKEKDEVILTQLHLFLFAIVGFRDLLFR